MLPKHSPSPRLSPRAALSFEASEADAAGEDADAAGEDAAERSSQGSDGSAGLKDRARAPVSAVIERARDMGLMTTRTQQIGARLPEKLLIQAKKRTGLNSTTDLLAFALANIAIDDEFANVFVAARGQLDPDLDIGF